MQVPHLLDCLSTFYQSMESKTTLFSKLAKIEGKLDLLLAQVRNTNLTLPEFHNTDDDDLLLQYALLTQQIFDHACIATRIFVYLWYFFVVPYVGPRWQ